MNRGKSIALVAAGIVIGTALSGPVVQAAAGILAERSTQPMYVDGQKADLEAYVIAGNNYVKLRDVGEAVGFNVYWDGSAVQVQSDVPYSGEDPEAIPQNDAPGAELSSMADYSAAANPAAFTGIYTREAYNAAYEVLQALKAGEYVRQGPVHIGNPEDRWKLDNMLGNLWNGNDVTMEATAPYTYEIYSHPVNLAEMDACMERKLREWSTLPTDREKVIAANQWLCEKLIYQAGQSHSTLEVVSATDQIYANCATYANVMNYLCGRLGIPCIIVTGNNHSWNAIYCDGQWTYTDVSSNDLCEDHAYILLSDTHPYTLRDPDGIRFLKELLVPGSTK